MVERKNDMIIRVNYMLRCPREDGDYVSTINCRLGTTRSQCKYYIRNTTLVGTSVPAIQCSYVVKIKEAAIFMGGVVHTGRRHGEIIRRLIMEGGYKGGKTEGQGFVTEDGKFVGREEAAKIAFEAGQTATKKVILYSEDLY